MLVDSTRCSINGSGHTFSRPVKLVDGDLMLPREIITLLEREVDEEVFSYVEKTFTYTPPTFSATPRTILPKTPEPTPRPKWVVVLDPGHGGSDPGAIGPDTRVTEARLNLDIARLVADKLRARGCTVYLTRSSDIYLSLGHRVRFANNRDADVFVSIHHNASRDRSVRGFEVFYSKNNPNGASRLKRSVELGKSICNSLHGRWNTRNRGCKHKSLYVTRLTSMASVLVEVEFMTCRDIEKQMTGDWFQGQAAAGISIGIMNHLRN
ncbi:MAG: N-acetylmuramoyl-L-alanine amidase [Planctomycetota bacterium]|nr:N-acetylmuramoyl-L-alanine amidase [Planctomycetota bacterium]